MQEGPAAQPSIHQQGRKAQGGGPGARLTTSDHTAPSNTELQDPDPWTGKAGARRGDDAPPNPRTPTCLLSLPSGFAAYGTWGTSHPLPLSSITHQEEPSSLPITSPQSLSAPSSLYAASLSSALRAMAPVTIKVVRRHFRLLGVLLGSGSFTTRK